ncbi:MAG: MFS transporter [Actinomycetota bacterium]
MARERLGRDYRFLWGAATISAVGDGVVFSALPLLAVTLTRKPALVAGVTVAAGLPWLLFALIAGALVDRWDRRRVMASADGFRMAVFAVLGAAVLTHHAGLWLVYVCGFLAGTAQTLFDNAAQAILPQIVPRGTLESANARMFASQVVNEQLAGPPLGSFLFVASPSVPFLADAASFGGSALLLLGVRPNPGVDRRERRSLRIEIVEGLRWLRGHRLLRAMAIMLGTWNLVVTAGMSVLVLYAIEVLHIGKRGYGVLLAVAAAGGLIGTAVASRLARRFGAAATMLSMLFIGAATESMFVFFPRLPVIVPAMILESASGVVWNVITVSLRQTIIPERLLGRVNSVYRFIAWGTMPIGGIAGGILARTFGLRAPYAMAAATTLFMGIVGRIWVHARAIDAARSVAEPND